MRQPDRLPPPLATPVPRLGQRDGGPAAFQRRRQVERPVDLAILKRCVGFSRRPVPALAGDVADHARGLAGHHGLDIVDGLVGHTLGRNTQVVFDRMLAIVPAPRGDVHAAEEGDGVVDADDLLVMAGAHRMFQVKVQRDARMVAPGHLAEELQGLAGIDRSHRPDEDAHLQLRIGLDRRSQQAAQRFVRLRPQAAVRIEIPADDPDGVLGAAQHLVQAAEIVLCVDEERHLLPYADDAVLERNGIDVELLIGQIHVKFPALETRAAFAGRKPPEA